MRTWVLASVAVLIAGCPDEKSSGGGGGAAEDQAATRAELSRLARRGRQLFFGRAGCNECHKIGDRGKKIRGPNLGVGDGFDAPVGSRARSHRPELEPIEYMVESILDPDAHVVEGYARGVMKPPDKPPIALTNDEVIALAVLLAAKEASGAGDLSADQAASSEDRAARQRRAQESWADEILSRVRWEGGDPARGRQLFERLGCGGCHGNPRNAQVQAPDLSKSAGRLSREEFGRWIIAPPKTRMPSYDLYVKADDLDDLAAFVLK